MYGEKQTNEAVFPSGCIDNNRETKLYYPVCIGNNRQMKLYSPGCIDNNKKTKLYSPGRNCIDIKTNEAVFPWVCRH